MASIHWIGHRDEPLGTIGAYTLLLLLVLGRRRFESKRCCRICSKIWPPSTGWAIQTDHSSGEAVCLVGVDFAKKRKREKYLPVEASSSHGQSDLVYILEMGHRGGSLGAGGGIYSVVVVFVWRRIRIKAS